MKFKLESVKYYENSEIIKAYPQLKEFGYYEKINYYDGSYGSYSDIECYVCIYSIEELIKLIKAIECKLIVEKDLITIYDDYYE